LQQRGRTVEVRGRQAELSRVDRQVLELTAAGLSVREVAQRLFLTLGTVQATLQAASTREPV
jgi:DNA-binding NarL/FixJ family response regulator